MLDIKGIHLRKRQLLLGTKTPYCRLERKAGFLWEVPHPSVFEKDVIILKIMG